jgi:L-lactate dehydrogenase complex protein LldE
MMLVDIFIPCFIDQFHPETGMNMVKILDKLGVAVHYNVNQTCCGRTAFTAGFRDEARSVGEKFIHDFPNDRPIVCPSAKCVSYIRNYYPRLFHNTSLHYEYKQVRRNVIEFTDFLVNTLKVEDVGSAFEHLVTWHDSCTALRDYGLKDEPRILLNKVRGLTLAEMNGKDVCCGYGGIFSIQFEPVSSAMARDKVNNALATGAEYLVSAETTCLIQLQSYIDKQNIPLKTIHIIDVLASG